MLTKEAKKTVGCTMRFPEGLWHKLRIRAAQDHRSLNNEIIHILGRELGWKPSDVLGEGYGNSDGDGTSF